MGERKLHFRAGENQEKTRSASGAQDILHRREARAEIARFKGFVEGMGKAADALPYKFLGPYRTKIMQNEDLSGEEQFSIAREIERRVDRGKKFSFYEAIFQLFASYGTLTGLVIAQPGWALGSACMLTALVVLSKLSGFSKRAYIDPSIDAAIQLMAMEKISSPQASDILLRIALNEEAPILRLSKEKRGTIARFLSDGISGLSGEERKKAIELICEYGSEGDKQAALMKNGLDKKERERLAGSLSIDRMVSSSNGPSQTETNENMEKRKTRWWETARDFSSFLYRFVDRSVRSGFRLGRGAFVELPIMILSFIADRIVDMIARRQQEGGRWKEIESSGKKMIALAKTNENGKEDGRKGDDNAAIIAAGIDRDRESGAAGPDNR
jgi:hypothetical protein